MSDLKCPAGAVIEFRVYTSTANHEADVAGCRFRLSPKEGLETVTYENTGEPLGDVRITTSLSGMPLEVIGRKAFCVVMMASYTGASTVRGYTDEALTDQVKRLSPFERLTDESPALATTCRCRGLVPPHDHARPVFRKRVDDGTRTRDRLDHNQELYQLSYVHRAARFSGPRAPS